MAQNQGQSVQATYAAQFQNYDNGDNTNYRK